MIFHFLHRKIYLFSINAISYFFFTLIKSINHFALKGFAFSLQKNLFWQLFGLLYIQRKAIRIPFLSNKEKLLLILSFQPYKSILKWLKNMRLWNIFEIKVLFEIINFFCGITKLIYIYISQNPKIWVPNKNNIDINFKISILGQK